MIKKIIKTTTHSQQAKDDRAFWLSQTPEIRLDAVELLRIEGGSFCMNIQPDFKELLALLEKHQVEYMIVGGYAVAFHGYPRFTEDIDVYFENSDENINKIISALIEFGFSEDELSPDLFKKPGILLL